MRLSIEDYDDAEGKLLWCVVDHDQVGSDGEPLIINRYATQKSATVAAITIKIDEQETLRKRLWFMYLPRFEDTWETMAGAEIDAAWETLSDDEKDAAHEQWSSETFEEADTLDGIQAGLEMALAIIAPPVEQPTTPKVVVRLAGADVLDIDVTGESVQVEIRQYHADFKSGEAEYDSDTDEHGDYEVVA
jgi:hypothetical protein